MIPKPDEFPGVRSSNRLTSRLQRLATGLALIFILPGFMHSQQGGEIPVLRLSFSHVAAQAGEVVWLPIFLTSESNFRRSFKILLEFSNDKLSFKELEMGLLARRASWKIRAEVKDSKKEENSKLLEIRIDPKEASFFPSGAIAYARFQVGKAVKIGEIVLDTSLQPPAPPAFRGHSEPAKIKIYSKPIFGCFFYMH